jgi:hypothetical protein
MPKETSPNATLRDTVSGVARDTFAGVAKDIFGLLRDYAKDKPDVAAMWAFGLGILIGWKLRG